MPTAIQGEKHSDFIFSPQEIHPREEQSMWEGLRLKAGLERTISQPPEVPTMRRGEGGQWGQVCMAEGQEGTQLHMLSGERKSMC